MVWLNSPEALKNFREELLSNKEKIDSEKIDGYIAVAGYTALSKALSKMTNIEVFEEVRKAENFKKKSEDAPDPIEYVIIDADEEAPGIFMDRGLIEKEPSITKKAIIIELKTFMDKALTEGNPHFVLEGLIIAGYAAGADEGFFYIRHEAPLAVKNIRNAINEAESYGLIGKNILGSGFDFKVRVYRGDGIFISGGSAREYVESNVKNLRETSSVLNSIESFANFPFIIDKGADFFTSTGKETAIFSLIGRINNKGPVEVPMGATLREIIYNIAGGIPKGKKFKALQTGGASGGCIPEHLLELKIGSDELTEAGFMMKSGAIIVMDEDTCMVDAARYFIEFLTDATCGKCVPCREGLRQIYSILTDITEGKGKEGDIELLEELAETAIEASLCVSGKNAPNQLLSTLKYFRDEYEAHIKEKRCPALSCEMSV